MRKYQRADAIVQMNHWGKEKKPFLFLIDYEEKDIRLTALEEIDPEECLFSFPTQGNSTATIYAPLSEEILWHIEPPTQAAYEKAFSIVQHHLMRGDTFLCNLTCKIPLFTNLSTKRIFFLSHALYKLWFKGHFVCFSPEIFVRMKEGYIYSYPMKGTISATLPSAEETLLQDEKETAEHATIVDLIRNDLSMVATEVEVEKYRYVDKLTTHKGAILQTSSVVKGKLPTDYRERIGEILFRLLPAGSITGAPKPKTCEVIQQAEGIERGFYTGVMGVFDGEDLDSSVMIRFVEESPTGDYYFRAGGGITAMSKCTDEYEEVIQKSYVPIY